MMVGIAVDLMSTHNTAQNANALKDKGAMEELRFWPRTTSITLEVKKNHAHVTTQRISNKFIGITFSK